MVAVMSTSRYLIMMPLIGDAANTWIGGVDRPTIETLRTTLATTYPSNFWDVQTALVNSYNSGIPQDVIDFGRGITPSSLRADTIHLNGSGYGLVAGLLFTEIVNRGW
jgi:hypothetical protein